MSNGHHQGGKTIMVMYKIVNSDSDSSDPLFNCFQMPYGGGPTLSAVKQNCAATHALSHLGPEGYHWRVMVEDKPGPSGEKSFSWWDVQDGNAKLPVKQATQYELRKLLHSPKTAAAPTDSATKAAKGAFKMMGKAVAAAVGDDVVGGTDNGPPISVLAFKLLDLVKIHDDFAHKHGGEIPERRPSARSHSAPMPTNTRVPQPRAQQQPPARQQQHQHQQQQYQQRRPQQPTPQPQRRPQQPQQRQPQPQRHQPAAEASLMDFGDTPAAPQSGAARNFHPASAPSSFGAPSVNPNESRAEKLKREYAKKKQTSNRVWDDVDQRWVEVKAGSNTRSSGSAPPGSSAPAGKVKKEVGIKLDASSAVGKSANVQAAVHKRVSEMKDAQEKALKEMREIEEKKKKEDEEEDAARKKLEPKIKAWSEEHGKKKQLRALLASLHTILWPGAKWKQISIGDVLDDSKVKRFYHKATLVVHPDKTHHLPGDQRFLAKRIFDALSQAKTEFDNTKN